MNIHRAFVAFLLCAFLLPSSQAAEPKEVEISLTVIEIVEIVERSQTFKARCFLDVRWRDPKSLSDLITSNTFRNSFAVDFLTPGKDGPKRRIFAEKTAEKLLSETWWPDIEIANEIGPRQIENRKLIISSDGTYEYEEIFDATLDVHLKLHKFPFDKQKLFIEVTSFVSPATELKFTRFKDTRRNDCLIDKKARHHLVEWKVLKKKPDDKNKSDDKRKPDDKGKPDEKYLLTVEIKDKPGWSHKHEDYSTACFSLEVERRPHYYVWRLFVPFAFFLLLATCVFWLDTATTLHNRIAIIFTANLTAVAFSFVVSEKLPHVPYLTLLDKLITSGYLITGINAATLIIVNQFQRTGHNRLWKNANRILRFVAPASYILLWFFIWQHTMKYEPPKTAAKSPSSERTVRATPKSIVRSRGESLIN